MSHITRPGRAALSLILWLAACGCEDSSETLAKKTGNSSAVAFRLDALAKASTNDYPLTVIEWEATNIVSMLDLPNFYSSNDISYFKAEAYLYAYDNAQQKRVTEKETYYSNKVSNALQSLGIHNFDAAKTTILKLNRQVVRP